MKSLKHLRPQIQKLPLMQEKFVVLHSKSILLFCKYLFTGKGKGDN